MSSSSRRLAGSKLQIWPSPFAAKEHNEMFVCLRSMSSVTHPPPPGLFPSSHRCYCAIPLKLLQTTLCSVFSAGQRPHNFANTAWEAVHSCWLFWMFVPSIMHESQRDYADGGCSYTINTDHQGHYEFVTPVRRSCFSRLFSTLLRCLVFCSRQPVFKGIQKTTHRTFLFRWRERRFHQRRRWRERRPSPSETPASGVSGRGRNRINV